jgi:superfamily II DNA or RNA helicase
MGHH